MIPVVEFEGKNVAVFGMGRTGITAALALKAGGARVLAWDDNEEARAKAAAEGVPLADINRRDWRDITALVLSPGIAHTHPAPHRVVELARMVGTPIIGDIELFARAVNALPAKIRPKIIGVTGTNGKSTTTALIGHILTACGRDARIGGNIGLGVLGMSPPHARAIYVLELSSYQLELADSLRCDVALFLNLTPDHLARHGGMAGYWAAKERIFRNQDETCTAIIAVDDAYTERTAMRLRLRPGAAQVVPVSASQVLGEGVSVAAGMVYDCLNANSTRIGDLQRASALPGRHNWQNAAAAYAAARALGIDGKEIFAAITTFPGLPHRMEAAGQIDRVRFINDSKATNSDAARQALSAYPKVYWIAGGVAKEGGIDDLADLFPRMAQAFLIGAAQDAFAETLAGKVPIVKCGTLETAIAAAFEAASLDPAREAIVLFSPACASFDQFRDYEQRGDAFKQGVAHLSMTLMRGAAQ